MRTYQTITGNGFGDVRRACGRREEALLSNAGTARPFATADKPTAKFTFATEN